MNLFPQQYALLLQDAPGITDPASLAYRNESDLLPPQDAEQHYISHILPGKLRLSLEYQRRRNLLSDIGVLLHTLLAIAS